MIYSNENFCGYFYTYIESFFIYILNLTNIVPLFLFEYFFFPDVCHLEIYVTVKYCRYVHRTTRD